MSAPESVIKLAEARQAARAAKDFALSDSLRDQISALGFDVADVAGGFELTEKARFPIIEKLRDLKTFNLPAHEITMLLVIDGFITDAITCIDSIKANSDCNIAILSIGPAEQLVDVIDQRTALVEISETGWGEAVNALMKAVDSKYVIVMDPSTTFTGDAITPVLAELNKGEFVAVGWKGGLVNLADDWRSTEDKGDGEVDVLFSYFMAVDRVAALEVGGINQRAIYYRNADMEFALKLRHGGGRLLQMTLPLEQGRHHGYHDADATYREVQSKKNYDRILERFRGKEAILSPRR
jgi:hypothetical protein